MSSQVTERPWPTRQQPLVLEDLAAPRAAAQSFTAAAPLDGSERLVLTAGRWAGLVGSAVFAGWTSIACFVC